MATRKDLLKAHTFITGRLVSALVDRDPDDPEPPLRRLTTGMWVGIMAGILVLAGFGVVGLIRPGSSKNWQSDKTVIIDSSSGGVLAFISGKLYPVHNITSAKLATGGGQVKTVKPSSLRDFPRERAIGIRQAPAQLPDVKDLTTWPIRTCSVPAPVGAKSDDRFTTLEIGTGDVPGTSTSFIARSDGVDGREYLVAEGRAYELPTHAVALHLGFGEQVVRPGDAWLRSLPQGPPLRPMEIPGRGSRSRNPVSGLDPTIGTLMHVDGAVRTWYVLLAEGLSEISPLEAAVLEVSTGKKSIPVRPADANDARNPLLRSVAHPDMPFALPVRSQIADPARATACATWPEAGTPRIAFNVPTPPVSQQASDDAQADAIVMPSLRGALVKAEGSVGPDDAGVLIVDGKKYGIANAEAKAALGYGEVAPAGVSPDVLRLIPDGLPSGAVLSVRAATEMS